MKLRTEHIWQSEQLRWPAFTRQPPENVLRCGLSCVGIHQRTCMGMPADRASI